MFKIGDKVSFGSDYTFIGYIVGISIDPFEESEVNFEKNNWVNYTVRVFQPFYKDGYYDFQRTEQDLSPDEFRHCCQAKREFEHYQKEHNKNDATLSNI